MAAGAINIRLNATGTLAYYNNTTLIGTSTTALTDTNKWYLVEYRDGVSGTVDLLKIDDAVQITGDVGASVSVPQRMGPAGDTVADTYTVHYDDWAVDDAAFPGAGRVVLLLPISDNTRTNWTAGAGGTTNLFDAINNLPPAGLASASETDTSNIESASSTGTATYIANMTSYATAGISASDTIKSVNAFCAHGEDIATGTKTGSIELTGNPVVAAQTFNFGNDGGAHGAYLGLWSRTNKLSVAPSVTVGTSPTLKLVKTDTTTRVGCVCFAGIYVDYTEVRSPPFKSKASHNALVR